MNLRIFKLPKNKLFNMILLIGLLKPVGIEMVSPILNVLLNIDRLFAMIYITLSYAKNLRENKKNIDPFLILIIGILILIIISSLFAKLSFYNAFVYWYGVLCILLWGKLDKDKNGNFDQSLDIFRLVLQIYVFANFFFILVFTDFSIGVQSRIYLLGNKNMIILYTLPYILVLTIQNKISNNHKYSIKNLVCLLIAISTMALVQSGTGIIGCLLFLFLLYFPYINRLIENISAKVFIIVAILTLFLIEVFQIQNLFSTFIIDILGKDLTLTGRVYIWNRAITLIRERMFGYGWDAVIDHVPAFLSYTTETSVGHAHNFFLNLAFKGGMQSALLYLILLIQIANQLDKKKNIMKNKFLIEFKSFFIVYLVLTLGEAYPTNCLALFFCLYLAYNIKYIN